MTGITMHGEWPPGNLQHSVQNATGASQSEMADIGQECELPQKRSIRVLYFSKLRKWKSKFSTEESVNELTEDERLELGRLRAENKRLKMERDILEKATAFFVNEKP